MFMFTWSVFVYISIYINIYKSVQKVTENSRRTIIERCEQMSNHTNICLCCGYVHLLVRFLFFFHFHYHLLVCRRWQQSLACFKFSKKHFFYFTFYHFSPKTCWSRQTHTIWWLFSFLFFNFSFPQYFSWLIALLIIALLLIIFNACKKGVHYH